MGMLIGTTNDLETIANLNAAFNGTQLPVLRKHVESIGTLFDANHSLRRVAYRLGAFPSQVPLLWFGLLHYIKTHHPAVNHDIKACLQQALNTHTVQRVVFGVAHGTVAGYSVNIDTTKPIYSITLVCGGDYTGPADATLPTVDTDPHGNPVESANIYLGP